MPLAFFKVAAYNRQGMGPFSDASELLVGPGNEGGEGDGEDGSGAEGGGGLFHPVIPHPESAPGLDLAAQEVWFVAIISFLAVVLLVGLVAIVCVRQRHLHEKSVGHYNGECLHTRWICPPSNYEVGKAHAATKETFEQQCRRQLLVLTI